MPTALTPKAWGGVLRDHRGAIAVVQWAFVLLYLVLLIVPVLPGLAPEIARPVGLAAEVLFWGVWWPGVILSMLLFGQFWCGLFCPDGTLTEFASRHGRGAKIPAAWLRLPALPIALFAATSLIEYSLGTHVSAHGTLAVTGSTSLLALACGALFGRGKRVWCRYACPVGGVFSLLARCAVLHYRVDRAAWDAASRPAPKPVDCPPLLDIRRLTSNEKCNMCGRCSGHRNAVELAWRPPGEELMRLRDDEVRRWEAAAIVFVLIGLLYGCSYWKEHGPAAILLAALGLGTTTALFLVAATGDRDGALRLAYTLIPLGGFGLFLGALEHALHLLHEAGCSITATGLYVLRVAVLAVGTTWSGWAGLTVLAQVPVWRRVVHASGLSCLAVAYTLAPNPFPA